MFSYISTYMRQEHVDNDTIDMCLINNDETRILYILERYEEFIDVTRDDNWILRGAVEKQMVNVVKKLLTNQNIDPTLNKCKIFHSLTRQSKTEEICEMLLLDPRIIRYIKTINPTVTFYIRIIAYGIRNTYSVW